ncbi:MAG: GumN family protein [Deltaproteobacteria bacterium]|nr:GumN family protein [Deltaproteobacteria bacterium]
MKRSLFVTLASFVGLVGSFTACKQAAPNHEVKPAEVAKSDKRVVEPPSSGSAAAAADPWTKTTTTEPKDPLEKPLLWSIAKDGKTTYALGTMHIGIDAESRLPQIVWDKLDAAARFAMETNLNDPALAGMGKRTAGGTLHDELGPEYWKKLEATVGSAMARGIDTMKPMIAATLLSLRGLPTTPPMDGVLHGRAINQHKEIVFLEEAAKEAAILEKWMDLRMLKMMLDEPEKGIQGSKDMLAAYAEGDEGKIVALSDSQRADALAHGFTAKEYDESMEDLLYHRNASWIGAIEKMHAAGGGFIAVGALHLVGKRSVLDLLAAKGYQITRVSP